MLLQGWEQFDEPVDRIVSIGAFEHFGFDRYDDFFKMAYDALPDDGVMLLHTITALTLPQMAERGMPLTFDGRPVRQVHPDRDLPRRAAAVDRDGRGARGQGRLHADPRRSRCSRTTPRTLDIWAAALEAHKDEAIAIQSEEVYDRYMKYLTGCADVFRDRLHRRQPVHARQVTAPTGSVTAVAHNARVDARRARVRSKSDRAFGTVVQHRRQGESNGNYV